MKPRSSANRPTPYTHMITVDSKIATHKTPKPPPYVSMRSKTYWPDTDTQGILEKTNFAINFKVLPK